MGDKPLIALIPRTHIKTLISPYARDQNQARQTVKQSQVAWKVPYPDYDPPDLTMPHILKKPVWADPHIRTDEEARKAIKFNAVDGKIDRRSHHGPYKIDDEGSPINPVGRTGLRGRGTLGRWGPNHAADPIVTRWKRCRRDEIITDPRTGRKVLQFIAITRRDHGDWAIPGGMVDAGETITRTLRREFGEEAMNSLEMNEKQKDYVAQQIETLFASGVLIYKGYVDDPRNTDNAWMETQAYNFHDDDGFSVGAFRLNAGDDATGVKWIDISSDLKLFASHEQFMKKVAERHCAYW